MALMLPKAILVDMDGTLTRPMLDFPAIKAEMGIGTRAILEAMVEMSQEEQARCQLILDRHEQHAAEHSELNEGCLQTLAMLSDLEVGIALITRNSRRSVETVLVRHGLAFACVISRETAPPKPHPQALRVACDALGVAVDDAWMVGDGRYDIEAGLAAGIKTVWLSHGQEKSFPAIPWRTVSDLWEFQALLRQCERRST
jgi:HAD superfamily hydrolase (TIGR01509 family)